MALAPLFDWDWGHSARFPGAGGIGDAARVEELLAHDSGRGETDRVRVGRPAAHGRGRSRAVSPEARSPRKGWRIVENARREDHSEEVGKHGMPDSFGVRGTSSAKPLAVVLVLGMLLVMICPGLPTERTSERHLDAQWQDTYRVSAQDAHRVARACGFGLFPPTNR